MQTTQGNTAFPITIILLLFSFLVQAQTVRVIDQATLQPLPFVTVYTKNPSLSAIADQRGRVDISGFLGADSIFFRIVGYHESSLSYVQLEQNNFRVLLAEKRYHLEEVVISAHRWEEKHEDVPNQILKITPREIELLNPQTSADALAQSGEVFVQKSQLGGGSPMIRGFSANSVLIVVDGVRMNNAIYRSGNLQNIINIDPNTLESAEVLFGPGSVLYGSDALGGVMNFSTKKPLFSDSEKSFVYGSAFTRYATANNEKTGHVGLNIGTKKLASYTAISYSDFDDLRTGNIRSPSDPDFGKRQWYVERIDDRDSIVRNPYPNIQRHSGFSQYSILQKLRYRVSENMELEYGFKHSSTSDIPRYERLTELTAQGHPRNAEWFYGPQSWTMHNLNANIKASNIFMDEMKVIIAYQNYEESRFDRRFNNNWRRKQQEQVGVFSTNVDFKKEVREKNEFYYGMEFFTNHVQSKAERTNINTGEIRPVATRYPDGGSKIFSSSGYLQYVRKLSDKLNLSAGGRYNYYSLNALINDTTFFNFPYSDIVVRTSAVNGSVGLVYNPNEKWRLNINGASGFRAPNLDDIAKIFDSEPGRVIVPNPTLGPEYSYTLEAGVSRTLMQKITLSGVAYYTWVVDAIERREFTFNGQDSILYDEVMSRVTANVNAAQAYVSGFSFNARADITEAIGMSFSVSYTEGLDITNQLPLRHIPPVFGRAGITYRTKKFRGEFYTLFSDWKHFEDLAPEEQAKTHMYSVFGTPAWFTLNFAASYQLNSLLQINAGLENILDTHYRTFASGISAPGRNLFVALRARF
jgi:hemoglobin/transferrin/lactoferrin receptor protein